MVVYIDANVNKPRDIEFSGGYRQKEDVWA